MAKRQGGTIDLVGWTPFGYGLFFDSCTILSMGKGVTIRVRIGMMGSGEGEKPVLVLWNAPEVPIQSHEGEKEFLYRRR